MSRFICSVLLLVFCSAAFSQKVYFVYLQSEVEQPFFVKMNEKTYSSTSLGYLILSQLKDSSYNFKVGFPQNKWTEQQFSVTIKSRDHGFLLKNFGEKGWGLFDLQTLGLQMAAENDSKDKAKKTELKEVSAFTETLSKATNDPSLKEKPVFAVVKQEAKADNIQPVVVKEEKAILKEQPVSDPDAQIKKDENKENVQPAIVKEEKTVLKEQPDNELKEQIQKKDPPVAKKEVLKKEVSPALLVKEEAVTQKGEVKEVDVKKEEIKAAPVQEYKKSIVLKKSESSTTDGFGLTFIDQYPDGQKDTIQIIIPNPKSMLVNINRQPSDEGKFIDAKELPDQDKLSEAKKSANINCSTIASQNDFLRLRKKMAGQKTGEAMINEANKGFKAKCFTIEQIKNLGNLFQNEAGKFQFYEAAYPYSSDRESFTVLQIELKDNYFIHRFKNLVKTSSL